MLLVFDRETKKPYRTKPHGVAGLIGQIRVGYARLSDLTQRVRPLVKSIADTCKDVGIIGGLRMRRMRLWQDSDVAPLGNIAARLWLSWASVCLIGARPQSLRSCGLCLLDCGLFEDGLRSDGNTT
jgi:hypothetical protein